MIWVHLFMIKCIYHQISLIRLICGWKCSRCATTNLWLSYTIFYILRIYNLWFNELFVSIVYLVPLCFMCDVFWWVFRHVIFHVYSSVHFPWSLQANGVPFCSFVTISGDFISFFICQHCKQVRWDRNAWYNSFFS